MAAGKGTRVSYAKDFNKALLPVGEKSALSHIIDKFPKDTEFIIPIGYNGRFIKDFVGMVYGDRKITLVNVENYDGPGSGPGHSLYCCKDYLQCPFIFTSVDTIVLEDISEPSCNWLGVAKGEDTQKYCMAEVHDGKVKAFHNKVPMADILKRCDDPKQIMDNTFIGMAGVYDYQDFWDGFKKEHQPVEGEAQVMDGLEALIERNLHARRFTWFDTGSDMGYYFTNEYFSKLKLLIKPDEFIFFENDLVIKYFADKSIIAKRIARAGLLKGIVPELVFKSEHFYAYHYVEGMTLSSVTSGQVFKNFLSFCQNTLWIKKNAYHKDEFDSAVKKFYYSKTLERIESFYSKTGIKDEEITINDSHTPKLADVLASIDWKRLCEGVPVLFHGDLQPENIIVRKDGFTLIDWRQDFGTIMEYGDMYYDFAKLYHALIISHEIIRKKEFFVRNEKNRVELGYYMKDNLCEFKEIFEEFLQTNGYDVQKVKILSSLIFLNIAPLHHYPYNVFLYYLGRSTLYQHAHLSITK